MTPPTLKRVRIEPPPRFLDEEARRDLKWAIAATAVLALVTAALLADRLWWRP